MRRWRTRLSCDDPRDPYLFPQTPLGCERTRHEIPTCREHERIDDSLDMKDVARHTLEMVQIAEQGDFEIVWSAEHHALEMTIAPQPVSTADMVVDRNQSHPPWHSAVATAGLLAPDQPGRRGGVYRPYQRWAVGIRHRIGCVSARIRPHEAGAEAIGRLALYARDAACRARIVAGGLCP